MCNKPSHCTLNLHSSICQLYLNEAGKNEKFIISPMILSRVTKKLDARPPLPPSQMAEILF